MSEKLASTPSPAAGGPADRVPLFFVGTEGPGSCLVGTGPRSKRLIETRREAGGGRCLMSETPRGGPTRRGWGQTPPALRVAACRRCPLARGLGGGAPPGQTLPPRRPAFPACASVSSSGSALVPGHVLQGSARPFILESSPAATCFPAESVLALVKTLPFPSCPQGQSLAVVQDDSWRLRPCQGAHSSRDCPSGQFPWGSCCSPSLPAPWLQGAACPRPARLSSPPTPGGWVGACTSGCSFCPRTQRPRQAHVHTTSSWERASRLCWTDTEGRPRAGGGGRLWALGPGGGTSCWCGPAP